MFYGVRKKYRVITLFDGIERACAKLRIPGWIKSVYLRYYRPSCTFFGYCPVEGPSAAPFAPWVAPSSAATDTKELRSQCASFRSAIARSHCGRCQYSFCANGLRALFPGSPRPGVAIRGRKMGKPASCWKRRSRRSDPPEIDRKSASKWRFGRPVGGLAREVPKKRTRWSVIF